VKLAFLAREKWLEFELWLSDLRDGYLVKILSAGRGAHLEILAILCLAHRMR